MSRKTEVLYIRVINGA